MFVKVLLSPYTHALYEPPGPTPYSVSTSLGLVRTLIHCLWDEDLLANMPCASYLYLCPQLQSSTELPVPTMGPIIKMDGQKSCDTVPLMDCLAIMIYCTLLEKQSKFPRYNMKCRGKHDSTLNIPRSITFSPLHFMLYRGKSISFGTVILNENLAELIS